MITGYMLTFIPLFLLGRYLFRWGMWRYHSRYSATLYAFGGLMLWPLTVLVLLVRGFPRAPQP